MKKIFFLDGLCSAVKAELLDCPHLPSALKVFLMGFFCSAHGTPQGGPTHP